MKKLLALLIAVMMVVALVPATVLCAMVPDFSWMTEGAEGGEPSTDTPGSGGADITTGNAREEVLDERVETPEVAEQFDKEFTEGTDKIEILNKGGKLVGYFTDLDSADKWVRDGDTLRLLADLTLTVSHIFGAGRTALAKEPVSYTIDGNEKTVLYTGADGYAWYFTGNDAAHNIVVKDLCLVSVHGGIDSSAGTGQGHNIIIDNCQIYANDSYYFVNPDFYTTNNLTYVGTSGNDALAGRTVNTYLTIKGENTKLYANNGCAVYGACVLTIYDGEFYSSNVDSTVYIKGDKNYYHRTEHKLIIYGGTFINDRLCAARVSGGATAVIFGGDFIMTAETTVDSNGAAVRSGTGGKLDNELNVAQTYIFGGNFYTDCGGQHGATAVPNQGGAMAVNNRCALYIAGGNFFYTGSKAYGGNTSATKVSASVTATTVEVTENNTLTVPSFLTGTGTDTVTWAKQTTVAFDTTKYADGAFTAEGAIADDELLATTGFEVAILNAQGKVLDLMDVDDNTDNAIHKGTKDTWLTVAAAKMKYASLVVPDGGTLFVLTNIEGSADTTLTGSLKNGANGASADLFSRLSGGTYTLDGNGKTVSVSVPGRYFSYSAGAGDVIIQNITLKNPTGRCLEFAQNEYIPVTYTVLNATIEASAGSAFVVRRNGTLNIGEGAILKCPASASSTDWTYAVQMHVDSTVNLVGGTIEAYHSATAKRSPFCGVTGEGVRTLNLQSGKLVLPWATALGIYEADGANRTVAMTLSPDVELVDVEGNPVAQPRAIGEVRLTNPGSDPVAFGTIAEALAEAVAGATIELLSDLWITEQIVIDKDLTFLGNNNTVYNFTLDQYAPALLVKGDGTDAEIKDLTIISPSTGIYVSPNEYRATILNNGHSYSEASAFTATPDTESHKIGVVLDNCKVLAGVPNENVFDNIDDVDGMKQVIATYITSGQGALLMHGTNVHVTVKGAEGAYMSLSPDSTVYNHGGYLDIYDGFIYGHNPYQPIKLVGRLQTAVATTANDQIQTGTTVIYGGRLVAGPNINASGSLIRVLRGHNLIVAGGELLNSSKGANVIRFSDSNKAGYAYILGGTFYNGTTGPVFGGNANIGYLRIFGGHFYSNGNPGIAHTRFTAGSFNINIGATLKDGKLQGGTNIDGATNLSYGMIIDEAYTVNSFDHSAAPVYPANTQLNYVKQVGFKQLQEVTYDEDWMEAHNYYEEGFAFEVTDGQSKIPAKYYSFELERALLHLGNGGALTLTRDITVNYLGKPTADDGYDTDYNFFARFRPFDSKVTFNSLAKDGAYYTMTTTCSSRQMLALYGGAYQFDNIGIVNTYGGTIRLWSSDSVLRFTGGYYEANATTTAMHDSINIANSNNVAYVEGGTFISNRASFALGGDATMFLGVEGTKQGPTIIMDGAQAIWVGGNGVTITSYYVTFDDVGNSGQNIYSQGKNFTLNIYDGYFYIDNSAHADGVYCPILQTADGSTADINIYGGTFLRSTGGLGIGNWGKGAIFEHDGTLNIYGGDFTTLVKDNTFFTIRKNNIDVVLGDKETGEGPTITTNGGHNILFDDNNTTNFTLTIYGGNYQAANQSTIYIGAAATVKGTVNIYGGNFSNTGKTHVLSVGGCTTNIYDGNFSHSGTSEGCLLHAGGAATMNVYGGKFTATGTARTIIPCNNATYNLIGGEFRSVKHAIHYTDSAACKYTINFGERGTKNGPYIEMTNGCMILSQGGSEPHITFNYITTNNICGGENTLAYYCSKGSLTIYDGDFLQIGTSRMFRIGSAFSGDVRILGGTFYGECSDLLVLADNCTVNAIIGNADGTGPKMYNKNNACIEVNTAKKSTLQIRGGEFSSDSEHVINLVKAGEGTTVTIETGTFTGGSVAKIYAVNQTNANFTTTINGGSFVCTGNPDACISINGGQATINAGYFYCNGMCVARAYGGKSSTQNADLANCFITTESTAKLIIKGGLFVLGQHADREATADNRRHDAVVRAGGWDTYGFVTIEGGTFINQSSISERVITKNNPVSTMVITGGIFLANASKAYYFKSDGQGLQNGAMLGGVDPVDIPVDRTNDLTVMYGNTTYHFYVVGDYSTEVVQVTDAAEIRVIKLEELNHYVGGLRFTSSISQAAIDLITRDYENATITAEYGTLIIPKDLLGSLAFTHAELQAAGLTYLDISADKSLVIDADGNATFTAAITEIKEENYAREFVAVGYAKLTIDVPEGGEQVAGIQTTYVYADYDEQGASLAELAQALLDNEPNAPAPYSAGLKAALTAYAAALPTDGTGSIPVPPVKDDVIEDPFIDQIPGQDPQDPAAGGQE